jgi:hypothetical protein
MDCRILLEVITTTKRTSIVLRNRAMYKGCLCLFDIWVINLFDFISDAFWFHRWLHYHILCFHKLLIIIRLSLLVTFTLTTFLLHYLFYCLLTHCVLLCHHYICYYYSRIINCTSLINKLFIILYKLWKLWIMCSIYFILFIVLLIILSCIILIMLWYSSFF